MVLDMDKRWTILTVIVLVGLCVLVVAYANDNQNTSNHSGENMSFNVSEGSSQLSDVINTIKKQPHYKGYDTETVKWMETLGYKKVFFGNNSIVIMDSIEAEKIPQDPGITDVYIYDIFNAEVVENQDLGNGLPMVYYVKNVDFIDQEIIGNGLA